MSTAAYSLHNDEPDLHDQLARTPLVAEVVRWVATCRPPLVVGIHGDWGSGKTSFLHQLQFQLCGECPQNANAPKPKEPPFDHVAVVWFEAWRYQHEEAPIVALLHEIRAQLTWKSHFWSRLQGATAKTAEVTLRGALMSMEDVTKKIGFQASKIQQAGETWEKEHLSMSLPSHHIRELLDRSIKELLGASHEKVKKGESATRLVVIIDDLDRCEAQTAFRLLEGIKIYLNLSSCVFILGINRREIERAIAKFIPSAPKGDKSGGDGKADDAKGDTGGAGGGDEVLVRAQEYLEKLCSMIWPLPMPSRQQQAALVAHWLKKAEPRSVVAAVSQLIANHACRRIPARSRRSATPSACCSAGGRRSWSRKRKSSRTATPRSCSSSPAWRSFIRRFTVCCRPSRGFIMKSAAGPRARFPGRRAPPRCTMSFATSSARTPSRLTSKARHRR